MALFALAFAAPAVVPVRVQAQEVVQQLPNPATAILNDAMRRLSRNPVSLPALLDAGRASIDLDDTDAAEGFFRRAAAVAPRDGAVLAGLALVAVRRRDPQTALSLFDQANAAGTDLAGYAADHGLALDLVGRNAEAQERYAVALVSGGNVEVERRLALSYAIAGDEAASEATLLPLLQRRDVPAYRTRAFALAILGREEEAVSIAETMLPARIARRMEPYLRSMQQLSRSQQAAAANLGVFPPTSEIGREPVELARRMDRTAPPSPSGQSDARLIPGGQPLGPSATATAAPVVAVIEELPAIVPPEPAPASEPEIIFTNASANETVQPLPEPVALPEPAPVPVADAPVVVAVLAVPGPSFSIADPAPAPAPASPVTVPPAEEEVSLAEAFAAFRLSETLPAVQSAPGAVDITAIVPRREVRPPPAPPAPPPPPPHPSRHWVQVATGQDVAAFRFDWRRLVRQADGALANREPYRARWGQTNRLVTGPFASTREAQAFITQLGAKGIDAFRFTSSAGEEVIALN